MVAPLMLAKYVNLAFGKGVGNNTDSNMDGSSTIYRRRTYFKLSVVFLSIRVNLVKKYIRSVTSSASIVLCAFIVCIPLSFASFVSLSCFLMLLRVVLSPFLVSELYKSVVGC